MEKPVKVIPIECKFGSISAYAYYIDAPEPVIIDAGIASSPSEEIEQVLLDNGHDIKNIKWILLTHGHLDHLGGVYALWEKTGKQAQVVIPEKEAYLLRKPDAHISDYEMLQGKYLDQQIRKKHSAILENDIGKGMEPSRVVKEGDKLQLGDEISISVIETPGHSIGSVTYLIEGLNWAFAADAVQMYGGANSRMPTIEKPALYRESIKCLHEKVKPDRLFLGHHFLNAFGEAVSPIVDGEKVAAVLQDSLDMDERLGDITRKHLIDKGRQVKLDPIYGPFKSIADEIGYTGNPQQLPCSFFVTINGYQEELIVNQAMGKEENDD